MMRHVDDKNFNLTSVARKLAEDCCKYGIENQDADTPLARAALDFGTSHTSMEDQRETMLGILGYQVRYFVILVPF